MKAFCPYTKDEANLRVLLSNMEKVGKINCDFPTFCRAYNEWHHKAFPGTPVSSTTVNFRDDWFLDFVTFLGNYEVDEAESNGGDVCSTLRTTSR